MGRIARFIRRPGSEKRLLLRALVLLAAVRLALWTIPYRRISRWARSAARPSRSKQNKPVGDIDQICRAISTAARLIPGASCLTQALVGQILLGRAGHEVNLQIGVSRSPQGPLKAHAWLVSAGRVILGDLPDLSQMQTLRPTAAQASHEPV